MGAACAREDAVEIEQDTALLNKFSKTYLIKNDYEMISNLGSGSFGKVRLYRSKICNKVQFAVKTLKKAGIDKPLLNCFQNEVNILRLSDHPNIVNFIESYENEGFIHIVTELLQGRNLHHYIISRNEIEYEEKEVYIIIKQILRGLKYLHYHNVVHRDMKPENIIFAKEGQIETLKIIDFGLATFVGVHDKKSCGSPYYMAPEMLDGDFNVKCDVWSVGIILYQMITGQFPFEADDKYSLLENIAKKKVDITPIKQKGYSEECQKFLLRLLEKDKEKRPTSQEALNDPWILKYDSKNDSNDLKTNLSSLKKKKKSSSKFKGTEYKSIISLFKQFVQKTIFQKEVLYFISRINEDEDQADFKKLFLQIDKKCRGIIKYEQFEEAIREEESLIEDNNPLDQKELMKIFQGLAFHNPEYLGYTEFIASVMNLDSSLEDRVKMAYKYFENYKEKAVTIESFINGIEAYSLKPHEDEISAYFKEYTIGEKMNLKIFLDAFFDKKGQTDY